MTTKEQANVNIPGKLLYQELARIYPMNEQETDFLSQMDNILNSGGDFRDLFYNSIISYVTRRLITKAAYIERKYNNENYKEGTYLDRIRDFLHEDIKIPERDIERIHAILLQCLIVRNQRRTSKASLKREAKNNGWKCFICGVDMDFDSSDNHNSAEVEHVWPKTLGGSRDLSNLRVSCRNCNQNKQDYINTSDFHFEEICLVSDRDDESFSKEMQRMYEIALWMKTDFKCITCGEPASKTGKMIFARKDPSDSWHYLNVDAYCSEHAPQ